MLLLSLEKKLKMQCSHCGGSNTKKNGHTHDGKQNYYCHHCQREFVEGGQGWFVSDADKSMINKLLLERISLAGICWICEVSQPWLLNYIKALYAHLPNDLTAELSLPDVACYLADRIKEEIGRIEVIKTIRLHYIFSSTSSSR